MIATGRLPFLSRSSATPTVKRLGRLRSSSSTLSADARPPTRDAASASPVAARARGLITGQLTASDVLRIPQVLDIRARTDWMVAGLPETAAALVEQVVTDALEALVVMRDTEGRFLRTDLDARLATIAALVSPYAATRDRFRGENSRFLEVFLDCPVEICQSRDSKGLYSRARSGELRDFTGISDPYEPPDRPELTLETAIESVKQCAKKLIRCLFEHGHLQATCPPD